MVTALFPAAGAGRRMQAGRNKVLLELAGEPVLVHTLRRFSASPLIDELVVVAAPAETESLRQLLRSVAGLKPWQVVAGGSERQYSIANGLSAVPPETDIVLVHDAARPLVSLKTIAGVVEAARRTGAAIAAVPEKNTIKMVDEQGFVTSTPPRAALWEVQTPQGFRRDLLLKAYRQAEQDGFLGTDDASLVERLGQAVQVVQSDYRNLKLTTPEDMVIAEALLHEEQGCKKDNAGGAAAEMTEG